MSDWATAALIAGGFIFAWAVIGVVIMEVRIDRLSRRVENLEGTDKDRCRCGAPLLPSGKYCTHGHLQ